MELDALLWVDWVGLSLAAYGLAAGAVRGLTQQFSRLLVWLLAVLTAGLAQPGTWAIAGWFAAEGAAQQRAAAWAQLVVVLGAVLALGALRRLLLGGARLAGSLADVLLGAVGGLGFAALAWLLVWGTAQHALEIPGLDEAAGRRAASRLSALTEPLPQALRSPLLELPPVPEDS